MQCSRDTQRVTSRAVHKTSWTHSGSISHEQKGLSPRSRSAHAVAYVLKNSGRFDNNDIVVINLSGRGDKDVAGIASVTGVHNGTD